MCCCSMSPRTTSIQPHAKRFCQQFAITKVPSFWLPTMPARCKRSTLIAYWFCQTPMRISGQKTIWSWSNSPKLNRALAVEHRVFNFFVGHLTPTTFHRFDPFDPVCRYIAVFFSLAVHFVFAVSDSLLIGKPAPDDERHQPKRKPLH